MNLSTQSDQTPGGFSWAARGRPGRPPVRRSPGHGAAPVPATAGGEHRGGAAWMCPTVTREVEDGGEAVDGALSVARGGAAEKPPGEGRQLGLHGGSWGPPNASAGGAIRWSVRPPKSGGRHTPNSGTFRVRSRVLWHPQTGGPQPPQKPPQDTHPKIPHELGIWGGQLGWLNRGAIGRTNAADEGAAGRPFERARCRQVDAPAATRS